MRERERQKRGFIYLQVAHGPFGHVEKWCAAGATLVYFFFLSPSRCWRRPLLPLSMHPLPAHYYIRRGFSTRSMMTTTNGCDRHTRDSRPVCLESLDVRCFFFHLFFITILMTIQRYITHLPPIHLDTSNKQQTVATIVAPSDDERVAKGQQGRGLRPARLEPLEVGFFYLHFMFF